MVGQRWMKSNLLLIWPRSSSAIVACVTHQSHFSIFDLDRTLSRAPTYSLFLLFAAWRTAPWRLLLIPLLLPFAVAYANRRISRQRMKTVMHRLMLGRAMPRATAQRLATAFADRLYETGLYRQAHERIAQERLTGRRVMIATAAPLLYAAPLAARLGVDVVASGTTWLDDKLLPRISGGNCYGQTKQRMLADYFDANGIDRPTAHIRLFSDDASDLPSFEWADEPIAVNASPKLRDIAAARKWTILDWKEASAPHRRHSHAYRLPA
jgi:phosphoserine phosphatase